MKNLEKLKQEQTDLKERLVKIINFINSEEYFTLDDAEKNLLTNQRVGMELYLNSLTQRVYGANSSNPDKFLPLMLMSLFTPFNAPPIIPQLEEKEHKEE